MEQEQKPRERSLMTELVPDWRPNRAQALRITRTALVVFTLLGVLLLLYVIGLLFGIKLLNLLKILAVPITVGAAVPLLNWLQRRRELDVENQRAQDEALEAYLDQISQLLTDEKRPLHRANPGDNLSAVARARTLTVLPRLDGGRKGSVVRFLYESGLIRKDRLVLDLGGADLSKAYLRGASLSEANLEGVNLVEADLVEADLHEADLSSANLVRADLYNANLYSADLHGTDLSGADLSTATLHEADLERAVLSKASLWSCGLVRANLYDANLSFANLSNTNLTAANLTEADLVDADVHSASLYGVDLYLAILSRADLRDTDLGEAVRMTNEQVAEETEFLQGATMPNGQKYEDWLKDKEGNREDGENSGPT